MVVFIILAVFSIPFFIWLSLTYVGYNKAGQADSKRKSIYFGFMITILLFNFISNNLFSLNASNGLPIVVSMIFLFSIYMLMAVAKARRKVIR
ncbi:hypothetical protein [Bacillus mesophilum]|uniref:Uncharacterized protein n=1 Tax=Bacillus mesophilum TaxID=1071718 RepID=A0A7V7RJU9_9BACI|nr:hypothetical protein [Bacillus mesophilum]KAB2331331.1 hypothetical protein F7732_15890 [Bacillus mesophilum]